MRYEEKENVAILQYNKVLGCTLTEWSERHVGKPKICGLSCSSDGKSTVCSGLLLPKIFTSYHYELAICERQQLICG
jgi:hypothetical protein